MLYCDRKADSGGNVEFGDTFELIRYAQNEHGNIIARVILLEAQGSGLNSISDDRGAKIDAGTEEGHEPLLAKKVPSGERASSTPSV